jgi:ubiquinone/menaquinone biosynthesis C-methylase UbiE
MSSEFNQERSEAFAGRMVEVLNDASLALMISIGHQVGLFDAMTSREPASSLEIADAARLNERYVREWLGAMVTGRIVDYDPAAGSFSLSPEHGAWLTRTAGANNLAVQMQYVPLMAQVEARIIESFREGGGVPYSEYPRFQKLMAEDSGIVHDAMLVDTIIPLVPELPERLRAGIDVADVGCGSGHAINLLAQAYPASWFVGFDFSESGIATARGEAQRLGLTNAQFEVRNVTSLEMHDRFDLITAFDAIHDQAQPTRVLKGIADALRQDGVFLMVDIKASSKLEENMDLPLAPMLYTVSTMHCMTVSLALDGEGLGTMWGEQKARQMLSQAGFKSVEVAEIQGDIINSYFIARKS